MQVAWQDPAPMTQANLRKFRQIIDRETKRICDQMQAAHFKAALGLDREGINHMTTKTNETVTLNTADGTLITLVNDSSMHADVGALAIVDRTIEKVTDLNRYLPVRWIRGHDRDGMAQMNGGYRPEDFEVHEFQIGDRVRVSDEMPFEQGYEGVIVEIPADNGDDCRVAVDSPHTKAAPMSYKFDSLVKQSYEGSMKRLRDLLHEAWNPKTEEPADDPRGYIEDDAEDHFEVGQRVTVKYGSEMWDGPGTVTRLSGPYVIVKPDHCASEGGFTLREVEPLDESVEDGGVVVIDIEGKRDDLDEWQGRRFRVSANQNNSYLLTEIDKRPDRFSGHEFVWEKGYTRPFDPATDFRPGDTVRGTNLLPSGDGLPAQGTVTRTVGDFGGDIEVDWKVGISALTKSGPLGYTAANAELVGTVLDESPFQAGDTLVVTGLGDSGHFLRVGSEAEVTEVHTMYSRETNKFRFEFEVHGEERSNGETIRQWVFEDEVGTKAPAEPEFEDFTFEPGQEIASSEALNDLPTGSVVVINGDEDSPAVKVGGQSFARFNRFTNAEKRDEPKAYFMDTAVQQVADGSGTVILAHVPGAA